MRIYICVFGKPRVEMSRAFTIHKTSRASHDLRPRFCDLTSSSSSSSSV